MNDIKAKMIIGSKPEPDTIRELEQLGKMPPGQLMGFSVFELNYNGKIFYCSWSGGELTPEGVSLSLIGKAAMESLKNLPMGSKDLFVFQQMRRGKTPLKQKICEVLDNTPESTKICFFGDINGELKGEITKVFTPAGLIDLL